MFWLNSGLFDEPTETALTLAVATGIGLLVGAERERRKGTGQGRAAAGIRTFALVGLAGGIAAILGTAALLVAGAFVATAAALSYIFGDREDPGITTEVALVTVFLLGALAHEAPEVAAAAGVIVTVLLASRRTLHDFVRRVLTEEELRDGLLFAGAALVVLPFVPDTTIGPYDVFNPFRVWLFVVLIMGVSGAGYIAMRAMGPRIGLALSGLAAGFVSSTATIGAMGSRARQQVDLQGPAAAGALLSSVATIVQMAIFLAAANADTFEAMIAALVLGGATAVVYGGIFALIMLRRSTAAEAQTGRPFDLRVAFGFAAILSTVLFVSAALQDVVGPQGVAVGVAIAGLADTHAPALSVASLVAAGQMEAEDAIIPILLAMTTNSGSKMVIAYSTGGLGYALRVWPGVLAILAALWMGGLTTLYWF
jgi:uncharacterized membrane protein (DUF4010 family)